MHIVQKNRFSFVVHFSNLTRAIFFTYNASIYWTGKKMFVCYKNRWQNFELFCIGCRCWNLVHWTWNSLTNARKEKREKNNINTTKCLQTYTQIVVGSKLPYVSFVLILKSHLDGKTFVERKINLNEKRNEAQNVTA